MFAASDIAQSQQRGIYAILNIVESRVYIGMSDKTMWGRWNAHLTQLRQGAHHNVALQADWNRLGVTAFVFTVIETAAVGASWDDLRKRECAWIDEYRKSHPLYNTDPHLSRPTVLPGQPGTVNNQDFINASEFARRVGVDSMTVIRWIRTGKIAAHRAYQGFRPLHLINVSEVERVQAELSKV